MLFDGVIIILLVLLHNALHNSIGVGEILRYFLIPLEFFLINVRQFYIQGDGSFGSFLFICFASFLYIVLRIIKSGRQGIDLR